MTIVVRRIAEHLVAGKRLGRHVEHDERSRGFPAERAQGPLGRVVHRRHAQPFDQDLPRPLGSCTGNAVAGVIDTAPLWRPRHILREPQAVRIYSLATQLDDIDGEFPPDDTGSSGIAACKAAVQLGYLTGYTWAFGIQHALEALQKSAVITGVDWYEGFDTPDAGGLVRIAGQVRGGHEFEVAEYHPDPVDPLDSLLGCWNSWGKTFAKGGRFFMTVRTWAALLEAQGDVTVPLRSAGLSGAQDALRRAAQPTSAEAPGATSFPLPGPTVEDTRISYDAGSR